MTEPRLRLDKWLWYARFFKTRTLAADTCALSRIRVNGTLVSKPHYAIKPGDTLTFPLAGRIRVVRVVALGIRRGPAQEASALFEDLSPPVDQQAGATAACNAPQAHSQPAGGPSTKADRRAIDRLNRSD